MASSLESNDQCPVRIPVGGVTLDGDLCLPQNAGGVVIFAHGSGSSRFSVRNRYVAQELRRVGLGTLLFDLLTRSEEEEDMRSAGLRFDIELLAGRLTGATEWVAANPETSGLKFGYFGASTGAAAALVAAAGRTDIAAIVSRGGRPDLAGSILPRVTSPALLIVGGDDRIVIGMNSEALRQLKAKKKMVIIPGATHLFEEPGALEEVARLAARWFVEHLQKADNRKKVDKNGPGQ